MSTLRFFFIFMLMISCRQSGRVDQQTVDSKTDSISVELDDFKVFSVPFNKYNQDSNRVILGVEPSFDTSFVLEVYKRGDDIQGVLHEVLPINRKGISKFSAGIEKVLSFEGVSFRLDEPAWHELTEKAQDLLTKKLPVSDQAEKCFDGTKYYLAYNVKAVTGNSCEDSLFEVFVKYVKFDIVNAIKAKRN